MPIGKSHPDLRITVYYKYADSCTICSFFKKIRPNKYMPTVVFNWCGPTSLSLQKVETDLLSVVKLYESLISFVSEMRHVQFDEIEDQASGL
jgi:hypothetical protein